jgi:hypothetical protein
LALERLMFLEPESKVGYRWGRDGAEQEMMDYLEFITRVTSHIPKPFFDILPRQARM